MHFNDICTVDCNGDDDDEVDKSNNNMNNYIINADNNTVFDLYKMKETLINIT